jgi:hypothetical protein
MGIPHETRSTAVLDIKFLGAYFKLMSVADFVSILRRLKYVHMVKNIAQY